MKITVFGASGGIGQQVLTLAGQRGHDVRAVCHNRRSKLPSPADLHQRLARTLVTATHGDNVALRLISVSTGSMGPADAAAGLAPRLLFRFFRTVVVRNLGIVGRDLLAMERELAASGLGWYAVRPVKPTDGPRTEQVSASDRFATKTISRADVASYLLELAEQPTPHRTPFTTSARRTSSGRGERGAVKPGVSSTGSRNS